MAFQYLVTLGLLIATACHHVQCLDWPAAPMSALTPTIAAPRPMSPAQIPLPPSPTVASTDLPAAFDLDAALDAFNRRFSAGPAPAPAPTPMMAPPRPISPAQIPLPPSRPASPMMAPTPVAPEEEEEDAEIPIPVAAAVAPTPILAPIPVPTVPQTAAPMLQAPMEEEKLKPLTPFGQRIADLIANRRYKAIRSIVEAEFEAGMAKVRTDLARLQLRKEAVVRGTSNPDAIDYDLLYLTEIVGDAEKVLTERYNMRKQQFNQLTKIFINRRMAKYTPSMINEAADLIDYIVHYPIAESKKMWRIQKKDINNKMSV